MDTDLLIEKKFEMTLEDVKNKFGYQFVRSSEEEMILSLDASTQIISTGGSAIYSDLSMKPFTYEGFFSIVKKLSPMISLILYFVFGT